MKNLGIIAMMLFSMATFAQKDQIQERKHHKETPEMTGEQRATLMSKKMALKLDLNQSQQNDLKKLFTENAKEHDKMMAEHKAMKDDAKAEKDRFKIMNGRLDVQLAQQEKMKKILNEDQFKKWKYMTKKHASKKHHMMKKDDLNKRGGENRKRGNKQRRG
ncbi:hypothetical protein [Gillisia sp. CAL575]|uniref:hypothetical protein n=1 Tax=Gillisia sp. CAL575 TaxID=985255 RepID=UPI0003A74B6D|nr:hypothetical protein [Gillisia sp. CAL575]